MAAPDRAGFDVNNIHTQTVLSSTDGVTPVSLWADPVTHAVVTSSSSDATSANQVTIQNLTDQLAHLNNLLRFLTALQTPTSELRVLVNAGTLPVVTTVATLTNQAQIGTRDLGLNVMAQNNDYVANAIRRGITTA